MVEERFKNEDMNYRHLIYFNHHLIKSNQIHSIEKLNAKEFYYFSILLKNTVRTSQKISGKIFLDLVFK